MIRGFGTALFIGSIFVLTDGASAQEAPVAQVKPAEEEQERSTGLPSRVKWTFNLDAGWGALVSPTLCTTTRKNPESRTT